MRVTGFLPNKTHLYTCADDSTCRIWDMTSETELCLFEDHEDHVRAACASADNPNILLTGSYDKTVKLFDVRANKNVMSMDHEHAVEAVQLFTNDGLVASAGIQRIIIIDTCNTRL